jgi:hypothetical protein
MKESHVKIIHFPVTESLSKNERKLDLTSNNLSAEDFVVIYMANLALDQKLMERVLCGEITYPVTDDIKQKAKKITQIEKDEIKSNLIKAIKASPLLSKLYEKAASEKEISNLKWRMGISGIIAIIIGEFFGYIFELEAPILSGVFVLITGFTYQQLRLKNSKLQIIENEIEKLEDYSIKIIYPPRDAPLQKNERRLDLFLSHYSAKDLIAIRHLISLPDLEFIKRAIKGEVGYRVNRYIKEESVKLNSQNNEIIKANLHDIIRNNEELKKLYFNIEKENNLEGEVKDAQFRYRGAFFSLTLISLGFFGNLFLDSQLRLFSFVMTIMSMVGLAYGMSKFTDYRNGSKQLKEMREKREKDEKDELKLKEENRFRLEREKKEKKEENKNKLLEAFCRTFSIDKEKIKEDLTEYYKIGEVVQLHDLHVLMTEKIRIIIVEQFKRVSETILTEAEFNKNLSELRKQLFIDSLELQAQEIQAECEQLERDTILFEKKSFSFNLLPSLLLSETLVEDESREISKGKQAYNMALQEYNDYRSKVLKLDESARQHFSNISYYQKTLNEIKEELKLLKLEGQKGKLSVISKAVQKLREASKEILVYQKNLETFRQEVELKRKRLQEARESSSRQPEAPAHRYTKEKEEKKPKVIKDTRTQEEKDRDLERLKKQKTEEQKEKAREKQVEEERLLKKKEIEEKIALSRELDQEKEKAKALRSKIKDDNCFVLAREQFDLISNILNDKCGALTTDVKNYDSIKLYALLYSIMKCCYVLYGLSLNLDYRSILHIDFAEKLKNLKNNIIHNFLQFKDIKLVLQLGKELLDLFQESLDQLHRDGDIKPIAVNFSDHVKHFCDFQAHMKIQKDKILNNLYNILIDLFNDSTEGGKLHQQEKYVQNGVLQAGMYAKIFMAGELLKKLKMKDEEFYQQLLQHIFPYDKLRDQVSHDITDDKTEKNNLTPTLFTFEGRKYYHFEEFQPFQLLAYAKIKPEVFKLLRPSQVPPNRLRLVPDGASSSSFYSDSDSPIRMEKK